jgi:hypothetical protein
MGWADLDDGPLLDAMTGRFDALVTVDKNLLEQLRPGQARELVAEMARE